MRWWRRQAESAPGPVVVEDQVTRRLRELAHHWQRDPGVRPWADLLEHGDPTPTPALTEDTALLPVVTPAARLRGWGHR